MDRCNITFSYKRIYYNVRYAKSLLNYLLTSISFHVNRTTEEIRQILIFEIKYKIFKIVDMIN